MLNKNLNRLPPRPAIRAVSALGVVALSVVLASLGTAAQSFATFSGSVLGPTNGSIPKATLTLTNVGTLARYEVRSDEAGRFEFVGLPPGDYAVRVQSPGFLAVTGNIDRERPEHSTQSGAAGWYALGIRRGKGWCFRSDASWIGGSPGSGEARDRGLSAVVFRWRPSTS